MFDDFRCSYCTVAHEIFNDVDTLLQSGDTSTSRNIITYGNNGKLGGNGRYRGHLSIVFIATRHQRIFVERRTSTVFRVCQHIIYQTGWVGATFVVGVIVWHIEITLIAGSFLLSVFLANAPCCCEMIKLVVLKEVFVVASHLFLSRLDDGMDEVAVFDIEF